MREYEREKERNNEATIKRKRELMSRRAMRIKGMSIM